MAHRLADRAGILAVYFQAIQWLPLGRWNDQPGFTPFAIQAIQGDAMSG